MNPIIQGVGALASLLGIGSSLTNQYVNIHRQMQAPIAQQQTVACPPNTVPTVMVLANGQRQMVCVQEAQR